MTSTKNLLGVCLNWANPVSESCFFDTCRIRVTQISERTYMRYQKPNIYQ